MSTKTVSSSSGGQTETKTYDTSGLSNKCVDIQHTDNRTGENHSHEVVHGTLGTSAGHKKG